MTAKRETNFDLLRVLAMLAVIQTHVSGTWLNGIWDLLVNGMHTWELPHVFMAPWYYCISRFAVPCFVMLSGAFILDKPENAQYGMFYRKTFRRIGVPMLAFSLFYILYSIPSCLWGENTGWEAVKALLQRALSGAPYNHMWYLYMMAGVYALSPVVIRFKREISLRTYTITAAVFLLLAGISAWTSGTHLLSWDIGMVFEYLAYYMIGDVIRTLTRKKSNVCGIALVLAGLLIETGLAVWIYQINYEFVTDMEAIRLESLDYLGLPVMAASVLIFCGFARLSVKPVGWISELSKASLYVYLLHALFYDLIRKAFRLSTGLRSYMYHYLDGMVAVPALTLAVLALSFLAARLLLRLQRKRQETHKGP